MPLPLICPLILSVTVLNLVNSNLHPSSNAFVDSINLNQSTFTKIRLIGSFRKKEDRKLEFPIREQSLGATPDFFDAREKWPECKSIGKIWNQGECVSAWAIATTAVMSDRICIFSKGSLPITVSVEDLLSCGKYCGENETTCGCKDNLQESAWRQWENKGIVTGGDYNSDIGCKSYSVPPCNYCNSSGLDEELQFDCVSHCDNNSKRIYLEDLTIGRTYQIPSLDEEQMKIDIMTNGPVVSELTVYADFENYDDGVYRKATEYNFGVQTVKILGWGIENHDPFWLVANSWDTTWGIGGYFKILRGYNECGIESTVMAADPIF